MTPLSVLDLAPIIEGSDAGQALRRSRELAQHCETWNYRRFWLAEHHNMPGVASAATAVSIGFVAEGTSKIRIGAGGIMLPNHTPLVVAEQFGTLESLYPGRVDLGLGRAPGTDPVTSAALRRNLSAGVDEFPQEVMEILAYFGEVQPGQRVRAVPGAGLKVPVWILGSSLFGAQLAAALGLPYAFASHFAPAALMQALDVYRSRFRPSEHLDKPYAMIGVNVFAAESLEEAKFLFSSTQQQFVRIRRGETGPLPPPVEHFEERLLPQDRMLIDEMLSCTVLGTRDDVRRGLSDLIERTGADELIVASQMFDPAKRLRSYQLTAEAHGLLEAAPN